ncbi:MAG TPA: hypothetical protein P5186_27445 [Candidatus Paceibacterota bacterium]|nr:hypothetical protein [Verrucomicrobiota bacterium]HRY51790.1 hypothetical protein [Candidatus Paceibacterota bacterium]HSA00841.1 hypothetical protein [Candidatus Paceibacterota bacterium]
MIFKENESLEDQPRTLEQALKLAAPGQERQRCERRLAQVRAGTKDDQEAARHTRLSIVLHPKFFNVVVVQPSCSIVGYTFLSYELKN